MGLRFVRGAVWKDELYMYPYSVTNYRYVLVGGGCNLWVYGRR